MEPDLSQGGLVSIELERKSMNETLVVKNLLAGLCKSQSDLTWIEQDAVKNFINGKISQNTLQTILTKQ